MVGGATMSSWGGAPCTTEALEGGLRGPGGAPQPSHLGHLPLQRHQRRLLQDPLQTTEPAGPSSSSAATASCYCKRLLPLHRLLQIPLLILVIMLLIPTVNGQEIGGPPSFGGPVRNASAAIGKSAYFSCKVNNLSKYRVTWFHMGRKMLLTIGNEIITRIPRFTVSKDDETTWTLHISGITKEDSGLYECRVNTEPATTQQHFLDVVVPPNIVDKRSSQSSVTVHEHGNVTLTCEAEGNPEPTISWIREGNRDITVSKRKKVSKHEGQSLMLTKVSRNDMGAYLCIASNKVPPSVSKRIELQVQFSPVVLVPNQLMSSPLNESITLECHVEAFPKAVTFWRYKENMIMNTNKYMLEESTDEYKTNVKLTIHNLGLDDFGVYQCYSRNSFGENDGQVNLYVREQPKIMKEPLNNHINQGKKNEDIIQHVTTEHEQSRSQNQVILEPDADGGLMTSSNTNEEININDINFEHNSKLNRERGSLYDFDFISESSGSATSHQQRNTFHNLLLVVGVTFSTYTWLPIRR